MLGSGFRAGYRSDTPETGRAFPGSYQNLNHARINEHPRCPIELREAWSSSKRENDPNIPCKEIEFQPAKGHLPLAIPHFGHLEHRRRMNTSIVKTLDCRVRLPSPDTHTTQISSLSSLNLQFAKLCDLSEFVEALPH